MKRILGAVASALLLVGACGNDSTSDPVGNGGRANDDGGAAGNGGADDGGQAVTTPGGRDDGGGEGGAAGAEIGGNPAEVGGAGGNADGMGGAAGEAGEVLTDVSGHIRTFEGTPLPNAVVSINDVSAVTDDDGAFTIADVAGTYDLTIIDNDHKYVEIVEGMTTREPVVALWQLRTTNRVGGIAGKLSGGAGFPLPAGQAGVVQFQGAISGFSEVNLVAASSSFTLSEVNWEGPDTCPGLLTGMFWKQGLTGPSEYTGFGTSAVTLEDGKVIGKVNGSVTATNLAVTNPAEHTVTGSLSVPGTPTNVWSYLYVGSVSVPLALAPGPISVVVPEVDAPTFLGVSADYLTGSAGKTLPTALGANLDLTVPAPPQLVLPVADATGVTSATEFSWTKPAAGTFSLLFTGVGSWSVLRLTSRTKVQLPDLSAAGVAYAGEGLPGVWHLEQRGPAATPEEALELFDVHSTTFNTIATTYGVAERAFQFAD